LRGSGHEGHANGLDLIIIMIVALISTKLPILLGHDVWIFHLGQDIKRTGFWSVMYEARADLTCCSGPLAPHRWWRALVDRRGPT
jgi:hypothetical protein